MPSRNRVKTYVKNGYYHVYNRGVAKQTIFNSSLDYNVFLKYLSEAFSINTAKIVEFDLRGRSFKAVMRPVKNFLKEIELVCYCLMPNHFHMLIKQNEKDKMESFMRSLMTRYSQYFNKHYDRVGPLFQGRYQAAMITDDRYLLHLSRYIHLNPKKYSNDLTNAYSSYAEYLGLRKTDWIKPDIILKFFNNPTIPEITKINTYKKFVEDYKRDSGDVLRELTLE